MLVSLYTKVRVYMSDFRMRAREEGGATAAEYALLVALIAVFITIGAFALGGAINGRLDSTATCVSGAPAPC